MAKAPPRKIDPARIFQQADCFYQALDVLCNVDPDNEQLAVMLGEPVMVLGALTIELFLKCFACIETDTVPHDHDLKKLFAGLPEHIQNRLEREWDNGIAKHKAHDWDRLEAMMGVKIARDLPSALAVGSKTFELLRYSYEGNTTNLQYYLQELPAMLGRIILQMKPEFASARRKPVQAPLSHS